MTRITRTVVDHPLIAVAAASCLTRIAMLGFFLRTRPDIFGWGNYECGVIAAALAHGRGFTGGFHDYSGPTTWFAPLYPVILSGLFRVFGTQTFAAAVAAKILNILCATATAILMVKIGTRLCDAKTALIAGLVWALTPQTALPDFLFSERTLATMLMCLSIYLMLDLSPLSRWSRFFVCGTIWGVTGLASPATLAPLALMLVYLYKKQPTLRWTPVVLVVGACIVLAPWIIRDAAVFHKFVPVRDNGLAEIYFANVGYDENPYGMSMEYQHIGEAKFVGMIEKKLVVYVDTHPTQFFKDTLVRVYRFWTTPGGLFGYAAAVSLLAFIGLMMLIRKAWADSLPFLAVIGLYPLVYYMSVTFSTYRQPVDPFLYLLGAYALTRGAARL